MLTTEEAAEILGVSERQVRNLIKSGTLKAKRLGGVWMIRPQALNTAAVVARAPGRPKK